MIHGARPGARLRLGRGLYGLSTLRDELRMRARDVGLALSEMPVPVDSWRYFVLTLSANDNEEP